MYDTPLLLSKDFDATARVRSATATGSRWNVPTMTADMGISAGQRGAVVGLQTEVRADELKENERRLLEALRSADGGLSALQLTHVTGIAESSVHHLLDRAIEQGHVAQSKPRAPYALTAAGSAKLGVAE